MKLIQFDLTGLASLLTGAASAKETRDVSLIKIVVQLTRARK